MIAMHGLYRVISAQILRPYVLEVAFGDGLRREIDLSEVLYGELYGPLRDPAMFGRVTVDPAAATVTWPNGADFDPETLHDWPEHEAAFIAQAKRWRAAAAR
jgi:hypothetical protein